MNGQRAGAWKNRSGPTDQPKAPYIPQPDYTPLPTRRADSCQIQSRPQGSALKHQLSTKPVIAPHPEASATLPRIEEKRVKTSRPASIHPTEESHVDRVWHHPQWNSSQFLANDWSAALMKRLSVEAKSHREQKILREANKELERFETEIESYLEEDEEEESGNDDAQQKLPRMMNAEGEHQQKVASSGSSTPNSSSTITSSPPCPSTPLSSSPRVQQQQHYHSGAVAAASAPAPSASASSSAATSSATASNQSSGSTSSTDGGARRSLRDRDQISLESGYMSSYPGDAQRHTGAFWFLSIHSQPHYIHNALLL